MDGLGDLIYEVTDKLGFKHCEKCEERRKILNQTIPFVRRDEHGTLHGNPKLPPPTCPPGHEPHPEDEYKCIRSTK
jgi:hypothetical protein